MTIQPIEAVDLLAGLEEHRRCEHKNHGSRPFHGEGGEQFVRVTYPCCSHEPKIVVLCGRVLAAPVFINCRYCGKRGPKSAFWTPLGPANTTTR